MCLRKDLINETVNVLTFISSLLNSITYSDTEHLISECMTRKIKLPFFKLLERL